MNTPDAGRAEMISALFIQMILQQTNMALLFLGRVPHPETGETMRDIDGARLLIDQLEVLELKTRGNRNADEDNLLKQSLTSLRMAFVDAIDHAPAPGEAAPAGAPAASAGASRPSGSAPAANQPAAEADEEGPRKRFTKRY
jgi:Domain of unknown function (DUF1844)